jgi:hypothetical protein
LHIPLPAKIGPALDPELQHIRAGHGVLIGDGAGRWRGLHQGIAKLAALARAASQYGSAG